MSATMLSEEEKRIIEERVRYENEVRARYAGQPVSGGTESNGKKTYSDKLSVAEIKNVVVPQFQKAEEITEYVEKKAAVIQNLIDTNEVLEKEKRTVPTTPVLSIISAVLFFAWAFYAHYIGPTIEQYTQMPLLQKIACLPSVIGAALLEKLGTFPTDHIFIGMIVGLLIGFGLPVIVGLLLANLLRKVYTLTIKKARFSARIKANAQKAQEENTDLMEYYDRYAPELAFLPEKYQNYDAASHILELFQTFRVDSMKEAFNKYEEDLHNRHVEQGFESLHNTMMTTNALLANIAGKLDRIEQNTAETNKRL